MDKWDKDYTVIHQKPGEEDVLLSTLPPDKKRKLWANIKARDPDKAAVMMEGLAAVRAFFPDAELSLTTHEITHYLQDT